MVCTVCGNPNRAEIEAAIVSGQAIRAVARQFGASRSALDRHVKACTPGTVAAKTALIASHEQNVLEKVRALQASLQAVYDRKTPIALDEMDPIDVVRELARLAELEAKLTGQLAPKRIDAGQMTAAEQLAYVDRMRPLLLEAAAKEAEVATPIIEIPKPA